VLHAELCGLRRGHRHPRRPAAHPWDWARGQHRAEFLDHVVIYSLSTFTRAPKTVDGRPPQTRRDSHHL